MSGQESAPGAGVKKDEISGAPLSRACSRKAASAHSPCCSVRTGVPGCRGWRRVPSGVESGPSSPPAHDTQSGWWARTARVVERGKAGALPRSSRGCREKRRRAGARLRSSRDCGFDMVVLGRVIKGGFCGGGFGTKKTAAGYPAAVCVWWLVAAVHPSAQLSIHHCRWVGWMPMNWASRSVVPCWICSTRWASSGWMGRPCCRAGKRA